MKKIIVILICIFLVGCTNKNEFDIGGLSNIEVTDNNITLSIKDNTLSNEGATFILNNNSENEIEYGSTYELEIKEDNKWHKINVELYFNMIAYTLSNNESKELEITWKNEYGTLSKGEYRIIKNISIFKENETFYISKEFTIE